MLMPWCLKSASLLVIKNKQNKQKNNRVEQSEEYKAGYKMLFLSTHTAIATHLLSLSVENIN